ncbi:MAG: hypothetical protein Q4E24_00945 [bacterium]|nr:hypothetical protein [bacterium]
MADRKDELEYLRQLKEMQYFNREDLLRAMNQCGMVIGEHAFRARVERLISTGKIVRVGRNAYCVAERAEHEKPKRKKAAGRALGTRVRIAVEGYTAEEDISENIVEENLIAKYDKKGSGYSFQQYQYTYSRFAEEVAARIKEHHPYVEFNVFELLQLNEFLTNPILCNIIFISAKSDLGDFLFHTLNAVYPGKVLLHPTPQMLYQYYSENLLVIEKRISEAPTGKTAHWHTRLEKLLVDVRTDRLLLPLLREMGWEEYQWVNLYEKAFGTYGVDESCLFRYAKRRAAESKIREFIEKETKIQLRLPKK